jgi:hypothetical protein
MQNDAILCCGSRCTYQNIVLGEEVHLKNRINQFCDSLQQTHLCNL